MTITSHLTVDLETLSTDPSALILSIGASIFHVDDGTEALTEGLYNSFYCEINKKDQVEVFGRDISESTLAWWSKQSSNAPRVLTDSPEKLTLPRGLSEFSDWIVGLETEVVVYGNASCFDNSILRSAYTACGLEYPWSYRRDACYRTLMMNPPLHYSKEDMDKIAWQEEWQTHIALDDAQYEGWWLKQSYPTEHFIAMSNKLLK